MLRPNSLLSASRIISIFTISLVLGLAACGKAKFAGNTGSHNPKPKSDDTTGIDNPTERNDPRKPAIDISKDEPRGSTTNPRPGESDTVVKKVFEVKCTQGAQGPQSVVEYAAPADHKIEAQVRGEFCPTSMNPLTVLFVVDFSASMGRHYPMDSETINPGHDPQIGGSCGRLRAAQVLVEKIAGIASPTDNIRIGMVPFAGEVLSNLVMEYKTLDQFRKILNKDHLCRYVAQDNSTLSAGAIPPILSAASSATNYQAAFAAAQAMLANVSGRKELYFISDGEPTIPKADPIGAGTAAGAALRDKTPNLTFNGIVLGDCGDAAQKVLTGVAGSKDRVKCAANADALAAKILEFPDPNLSAGTLKATLSVSPYKATDVGVMQFGKQSKSLWTYMTQPFLLVGKQGQAIDNHMSVTVQGADGSRHQSDLIVRYTRQ